MKQKPSSRIQGFTLVELMVVIVIMAIMASLVMLNIKEMVQRPFSIIQLKSVSISVN